MEQVECIVIGAGVIGLAVASRLARNGMEVLVLEQHAVIGSEISSRNSEVIHAGIYYPTGSLKAELCVAGKNMLYDYCDARAVPHRRVGKVIVAANSEQVPQVKAYIDKGAENGVDDLYWIDAAELAELEPELDCVGAVVSPSTGIIDSHEYMLSLQGDLETHGGMVVFNTKVTGLKSSVPDTIVETDEYSLSARWVINCGGLSAPDLATDTPGTPTAYFAKGHYYTLSGKPPFSRLVYPVPFRSGALGVHVTLDIAGQVKFGPDFHSIDGIDYEFDQSIFDGFVDAIKQYYPNLDSTRLQPGYTGIRPRIADAAAGAVDFRIEGPDCHGVPGRINLFGIESPGLTSSLAIAERVLKELA